MNKLWTKNFTIITVGTVISNLGSAISGFAMALLVLDYTGSTFLYALYAILYMLPKIFLPVLAGPLIDKFSRRKTIYSLDFLSAFVYGFFALIVMTGHMNYAFLLAGCLITGSIDSVYMVAYDSFYPMLITEGNYGKAYSISSTLESLTAIMVPVSAFLYNTIGIGPLFLIDMVSFFVAAVMETKICAVETYVKKEDEVYGLKQYRRNFKEGMDYLLTEAGLFAIAIYFMVSSFTGGADEIIGLPYFREQYPNGEYVYIFVMGFMLLGRLIGGIIHYRKKMPAQKRFAIALFVYAVISVLGGIYLFLSIPLMMVCCFVIGILGVTSYNIRISATQSYVPDDRKGRFNGTFQMLNTIGPMAGQFLSGLLADHFDKRFVLLGFMLVNFMAVWIILFRRKEAVREVYNRVV
jgi:MFS family permease